MALLEHEYGHYLQAKFYGVFTYNSTIISASLYSMIFDSKHHNDFWTEKDANAWATWFFGKNSDIAKAHYLPKEFSYLMNDLN